MILLVFLFFFSCNIYFTFCLPKTSSCTVPSSKCPDISTALAIISDHGTISLSPGIFQGPSNTNLCSQQSIVRLHFNVTICPSKGVKLIGQGDPSTVQIIGTNNTRAITINHGSISFIANVTFQNFDYSEPIIVDVNSLRGISYVGAALSISNSSVKIHNSIFLNNTADEGGAIKVTEGDLSLKNVTFKGNKAIFFGGAIATESSSFNIMQCNFVSNSVVGNLQTGGSGGALFSIGIPGSISNTDSSSITRQEQTIVDTLFVNNLAGIAGGAIFLRTSTLSDFTGERLVFERNSVIGAGDCLDSSVCSAYGGAIYLDTGHSILISSIFKNNSVSSSDPNGVAQGGAIFASKAKDVTGENPVMGIELVDTKFSGNNAGTNGGALYVIAQPLTVSRNAFENNEVGLGASLFGDSATAGGAIWYSSEPFVGTIFESNFTGNLVYGGWGGAIFCSYCSPGIVILGSHFIRNRAQSSYTFNSQGGAIMISHNSVANITFCRFFGNGAIISPQPTNKISPCTYSGNGGAVYVQSALILLEDSTFTGNFAFTGQFDAGANGGAILLENVHHSSILRCAFVFNAAVGFIRYSAYSSSGSGGAIALKFSTVDIQRSRFVDNWASVGGSQMSVGGAIAVFFTYQPTEGQSILPIVIADSEFIGNKALGPLCRSTGPRAGQGGAIGIVGCASSGVVISRTNFTHNIAAASPVSALPSYGGAISVSLVSNLVMRECVLNNNIAFFGVGNDVASVSGGENQNPTNTSVQQSLNITSTNFTSVLNENNINGTSIQELYKTYAADLKHLCETVQEFVSKNIATLQQPSQHHSAQRALSNNVFDHNTDSIHDIGPSAEGGDGEAEAEAEQLILDSIVDSEAAIRDMDSRLLQTHLSKQEHALYSAFSLQLSAELVDLKKSLTSMSPSEPGAPSRVSRELKSQIQKHSKLRGRINILIATGTAKLNKPIFNGHYKIVVGDILLLQQQESAAAYSEGSSTVVQPTSITIKDDKQQNLLLTVFRANAHLMSTNGTTVTLESLLLFNSTLFIDKNVSVLGNCSLIDSTLNSTVTSTLAHGRSIEPALQLKGGSLTGIGLQPQQNFEALLDEEDEDPFRPLVKILKSLIAFTPVLVLDGVVLEVFSTLRLADLLDYSDSLNTNFYIRIANNGQILVHSSAEVTVATGTTIVSDNSSATVVVNSGRFILDPSPIVLKIQKPVTEVLSVYSKLKVVGVFEQTAGGVLSVTVNNPNSDQKALGSIPILDFSTNKSFSGVVKVNLVNGTLLTAAAYGAPYSSNWSLASFGKLERSVAVPAAIESPAWSHFSADVEWGSTNYSTIVVDSISCQNLAQFYAYQNSPPNAAYLCYLCSLNSSCSFDLESGTCMTGGAGPNSATSCCSSCGAGSCQPGTDYQSYQCTSVSQSGVLSEQVALEIAFGVVVVLIIFGVCVYWRYAEGQKSKIFDDLRQNLLAPASLTRDRTNNVPREFIEEMQQNLILKDVFVKYEDVKIECKIGEGSFGEVFKASFRGAQVAVKQMRSPMFMQISQSDIEEFRKEAYMMSRLRHPNIVLVMGISLVGIAAAANPFGMEDDDADMVGGSNKSKKDEADKKSQTVCIITEFLEQGSLADILYGHSKLPDEVWTYEIMLACALQAARGMLYLHSHSPPICHRDLKGSNLVVDDHWVVKVTDFGMSRIVPEKVRDMEIGLSTGLDEDETDFRARRSIGSISSVTGATGAGGDDYTMRPTMGTARPSVFDPEMTGNLGTTAWCAPELLTATDKTRYSIKVDVYSFGMVLWEMWAKQRPWEDLTSRFDIIDAIRAGKRPAVNEKCPPAYKSIMQRCWQAEPARRPTFQYIERYLKDELARVRRQRYPNGRVSESSYASAGIRSMSFSGMRMSNVEEEPPELAARSAVARYKDGLFSTDGKERLSLSADNKNMVINAVGHAPRELIVPEGREPLVAFDRSISSLVGTPSTDGLHSPLLNSRGLGSSGDNVSMRPSGQPAPTAHQSWRNKYVMKFSGWQASKPDEGLPPSMSPAASSAVSPIPLLQGPASSASGASMGGVGGAGVGAGGQFSGDDIEAPAMSPPSSPLSPAAGPGGGAGAGVGESGAMLFVLDEDPESDGFSRASHSDMSRSSSAGVRNRTAQGVAVNIPNSAFPPASLPPTSSHSGNHAPAHVVNGTGAGTLTRSPYSSGKDR